MSRKRDDSDRLVANAKQEIFDAVHDAFKEKSGGSASQEAERRIADLQDQSEKFRLKLRKVAAASKGSAEALIAKAEAALASAEPEGETLASDRFEADVAHVQRAFQKRINELVQQSGKRLKKTSKVLSSEQFD
eukprot:tig00020965_g16827.t1